MKEIASVVGMISFTVGMILFTGVAAFGGDHTGRLEARQLELAQERGKLQTRIQRTRDNLQGLTNEFIRVTGAYQEVTRQLEASKTEPDTVPGTDPDTVTDEDAAE